MFSETRINNKNIKNRIIRSATNEHLGSKDGIITNDYLNTYKSLAVNGLGIIITSHMAINELQKVDETQICIAKRQNSDKLKKLAEIVHESDCIIIAQLSQGGRKSIGYCGTVPLTPSEGESSSAMSKDDIKICIEDFIHAAKIAENSGFDGVQLHLAHGYLLCDFLDPSFNNRTDEYGGELYRDYRIIHEIVKGIRDICNKNFILSVKINSTYSSTDCLLRQVEICKWLERDGVNLIEVSGHSFNQKNRTDPYFINEALTIKKSISIPIALVGGFRDVKQIRNAINKGIDYISISRPFICEDNLIFKLKNGESSACNDCNKCYSIFKTEFKRCAFHKKIILQLKSNFG